MVIWPGIKNLGLSFWRNFKPFSHLLGTDGLFGEDEAYQEDRDPIVTIPYGIITLPAVLLAAAFTNTVDFIVSTPKNLWRSYIRNLTPFYNLLGEDGIFGKREEYKDDRKTFTKLMFGALTLPFVLLSAAATNLLDIVIWPFIKNFGLSFKRNFLWSYNFILDGKGIFETIESEKEDRREHTIYFFGTLTAPFVVFASVITNIVDLVGGYFKHWKKTIKEPALIATGVTIAIIGALPMFVLRKTLTGLYNCTLRPIIDAVNHKDFNPWRFLRGIANTVTLGLFSAFTKIFKHCTGYSHRFGFLSFENPNSEFAVIQNKFHSMLQKSFRGKFEQAGQGTIYRSFLRLFYGIKHTSEKIIKELHDAFIIYENNKQNGSVSSFGFFSSEQYINKKKEISDRLHENQMEIMDEIVSDLKLI
jgi:hypothetical protein